MCTSCKLLLFLDNILCNSFWQTTGYLAWPHCLKSRSYFTLILLNYFFETIFMTSINRSGHLKRHIFKNSIKKYFITFQYEVRWKQTLYQNCGSSRDLHLCSQEVFYLKLIRVPEYCFKFINFETTLDIAMIYTKVVVLDIQVCSWNVFDL